MSQEDAAIRFSLNYLSLLEKHLRVSWNERGQPVCVIDWITDEAISVLLIELRKLFDDSLSVSARQATIDFGQQHIQTIGFGIAPDFADFVKLGMLCGERVVLWDVIFSRILREGQFDDRTKSLVAQVACELLILRPVVERGGVVILAHPVTWSPLAAEIDEELRSAGNTSSATVGLSMALAAIEEGLPLHPYTLLRAGERPTAAEAVNPEAEELFTTRNYVFQQAIGTLLRDQQFAFLRDVRIEDFFDVVESHEGVRRALWKHFSIALEGLSPQQAAQEHAALTKELLDLIARRNAAVAEYVAEGVDASAAFVMASIATISVGMPLIQLLAGAGAAAVPLSKAVRKWSNKPARNVIVQAFQALSDRAALATNLIPLAESEWQLEAEPVGVIEPSIQSLYQRFKSFHWTQDRHNLLESLSPEVAKALLALLRPEDVGAIVNDRQFQEDYIGDYLEYLWNLDEEVYWEHLGKAFEAPEGLLIYDNDAHIENMENYSMPMGTWRQLLDSLFVAYSEELKARKYGYPLERLAEIVRFQTEHTEDVSEKRALLLSKMEDLDPEERLAFTGLVAEAYAGEVPGWFKSAGGPSP